MFLISIKNSQLILLCIGLVSLAKAENIDQQVSQIAENLRCLVCQNQSVAESDTQVARNMRVYIRAELEKEKSEKEIISELVSRYGEYVSFEPQRNLRNAPLWTIPGLCIIFLLSGCFRHLVFR